MTAHKIVTLLGAGAMLAASAGLAFAQTATSGGTGSSGNDSNNPAAIQGSGAAMPNNASSGMLKDENGNMKTDNSGAVPKPGKDCGQRGENQGTAQPDAKMGCE